MVDKKRISSYFLYAIGEIILVVIGILIALQINNWNTQRQLDLQEQSILKILKSEFLYNKTELERNIKKASSLQNRADSLLLFFNAEPSSIDFEDVKSKTFGLTSYSTYDPSNGALTNLISSGQLNLIKNDSLRLILSKWFGEVQDVKEDELRLMNYGDTFLEPIRLQYLKYHPDSTFDRNTDELLKNPEFENIVSRMSKAVKYIIENYKILDLEIDRILAQIEQEIE